MEKFSFDLFKMKFDATNPGKETKRILIILLIFIAVLAVVVLFTMHFLGIDLRTIVWPLAGKQAASFIGSTIKKWKGGRSP